MDYKEVIKERIKGLPETLRAFVLNEKWRRDAEQIGKQFNLNEEKYATLENEIFMVLLCFEPQKDFGENIKNELHIDTNTVGWITEDVGKNIFSKVSNELNAIEKQIDENEKTPQPQNKVGNEFEQIILNQAKAMRPAVPPNLPTENNEPKKVHDYPPNNDPYRERLQ